MPTFLFANNAKSTLASAIGPTDTTIFIQTGEGAKFPSPGAGEVFNVTLVNSSDEVEVCTVTARTNDTLTVTRGSPAYSYSIGDACELRLTTEALGNVPQSDTNLQTNLNAEIWNGAKKTVSTGAPSGGADGDVWLQYEP